MPVIALAFAVTSCTSDEFVSEDVESPKNTVEIVDNPFAISAEKAVADANGVLKNSIALRSGSVDGLEQSVNTTDFNVKIESLSKSEGKEIRQQVPVHSINYKDEQGNSAGFVLTVGDERISNRILAYSDKGEGFDFSSEDADFWKDRFEGYIYNHINNPANTGKKMETRTLSNPVTINFLGDWRPWADPYSRYTPYRFGSRSYPGSSDMAMGEIMAYNRWPQQGVFKRYTTNTTTPETVTVSYILTDAEHTALKSSPDETGLASYPNAKEFVGNIIAECGYRLNTYYDGYNAYGNPAYVPDVFAQMGYYTDGMSNFDISKVETDIVTRNYLVFMTSWPSISPPTVFVNNHSYIIKGYAEGLIHPDGIYVLVIAGNGGGTYTNVWVNSVAFSSSNYNLATGENVFPCRYHCKIVSNIRKNPYNTGCTSATWRASTANEY
jgi:hypothetical protein